MKFHATQYAAVCSMVAMAKPIQGVNASPMDILSDVELIMEKRDPGKAVEFIKTCIGVNCGKNSIKTKEENGSPLESSRFGSSLRDVELSRSAREKNWTIDSIIAPKFKRPYFFTPDALNIPIKKEKEHSYALGFKSKPHLI